MPSARKTTQNKAAQRAFTPLQSSSRILLCLLAAAAFIHLWLIYQWIIGGHGTSYVDLTTVFGGGWLAVQLAIAGFFAKWFYSCAKNLRVIAERRISYTPEQSLIWLFIPGLNLILPYLVALEMCDISIKRRRSIELVTAWWLTWLIFAATFVIQFKSLKPRVEDIALYAHLLSGLLVYPLLALIVFRVTAGQYKRSTRFQNNTVNVQPNKVAEQASFKSLSDARTNKRSR